MMGRCLLLAKRELHGVEPVSWERLRDQWSLSAKGLMPIAPVVIATAVVVAIFALVWYGRSRVRRRQRDAPRRIFRQVISGFGLTRAEVSLLIRIAHHQHLPTPLVLVLSPATFEHHAQAYERSGGFHLSGRATFDEGIDRIRQIVFGVTGDQ